MPGKTPWKKIDEDAYKTLVENGLDNFSSSLENKYEVDLAFQNMNSLLFNSAKSCCPTPRKRYRKPKLKVMNEDISGAIAMKKRLFINGRLMGGDTVYSTENNILSGWKHHFENLTKHSIHEHFDNKYQQKDEQEYIDIIDICRAIFQHQSITENEIVEALNLLNLNKSPDIFGASTENFLYGEQSLIYHIKELLDSTFRLCYIPDEQKLGIVIPLFNPFGAKTTFLSFTASTPKRHFCRFSVEHTKH
ncbi:Hypothetical predicted protein [Mytilus galloprovincialis]|uniref:Uncharacterized protein n=1 Tax=Mytilus galloprovincialis TaxID=29158 RepID=A0A8B6GPJ0_MYTGA|nr:Hypothetical predicted protein [Mytilus galloprovincialis]